MKPKIIPKEVSAEPQGPQDLIKTVSEVQAMTDSDKEEFRRAGGTVISDPQ